MSNVVHIRLGGEAVRHRGHADHSEGQRDRGRILILAGPLAAVFAAGCSRASPLRSIQLPTPVVPTPTAASVGMLRSLFPLLGGLADSQQVTIERRWTGFAVVYRQSEAYSLELRGNAYAGDGVVAVEGRSSDPRTETRGVTVPRDAMQPFLWRLAEVSVAERPYVPERRWTDDYPEIDVRVVPPGAPPVRFWTQSQGPGNLPWGVEHAGRNFVVNGPSISNALKEIDRYLLPDLLHQMVREMEDEHRSPVPKS